MFEDHYKDGSFAGEESRNRRLIGVRVGIFAAILVIGLLATIYMKWSQFSMHERLMKRHEQTTAYYDKNFFKNGDGASTVYSIGYTFIVNGKHYHNYGRSKTIPTSAEGTVIYNPDNPDENELLPF